MGCTEYRGEGVSRPIDRRWAGGGPRVPPRVSFRWPRRALREFASRRGGGTAARSWRSGTPAVGNFRRLFSPSKRPRDQKGSPKGSPIRLGGEYRIDDAGSLSRLIVDPRFAARRILLPFAQKLDCHVSQAKAYAWMVVMNNLNRRRRELSQKVSIGAALSSKEPAERRLGARRAGGACGGQPGARDARPCFQFTGPRSWRSCPRTARRRFEIAR